MPQTMKEQSEIGLIEGRPVLLVIDIQQSAFEPAMPGIPGMPEYSSRMQSAANFVKAARDFDIPIVFVQEAHRPDLVDFGRELDGQESLHCIETDASTQIAKEVEMRPDDYFIRKRRYSCFFGTDLEILLKGLKASTLILIGGLTDVCVHYTFVDGHQHDYYCRVVEDCVAGSSEMAHEASLRAMEYLQSRARCTAADVLATLAKIKQAAPTAVKQTRG
ncbi:MAG: isochorismatase family cysteine hydrolase [Cyanobacteria bacterium J06627_28]